MKIKSSQIDYKSQSGSICLIPNNEDDIYHLSSIIQINDKISSFTTRKISLDNGKTQKKISLRLEIKVESFDVDLNSGVLYVKGKTSCENEYVKIGSYHTLEVAISTEFTLTKFEWKKKDLAKIKELCKEVPEILFVIFYEKDCVISSVSSNGCRIVYKEEIKNKNFKETSAQTIKMKDLVKSIVIGSISEVRNDFYKYLLQMPKSDLNAKMISLIKLSLDYKGLPNSKVISKVLTDKNYASSLNNVTFVEDLKEIQIFFNVLDQHSQDVAIGLKEVGEAMEYGAIKILFVSDKFNKPKTISERAFVESLIKKANEMRAKVCIIPCSMELGDRLHVLGGIACTLAFKYK
jgi:protein pelota